MRRLLLVLTALTPCLFGYVRLNTGETPTVFLQRIDNSGIQFYLNTLVIQGATSSASGKSVTVISGGSNPIQAIELAQSTWNNVATANVKFLAVQSTTKTQNPKDCTNVISIADSTNFSALNGAIAITLNSSSAGSGVFCNANVVDGDIVDSDMLLNPTFSFSTDYTTGVDMQGVLTHEFGHALSANHTGVLGATMFQYSSINNIALLNQRFLSMDDLTFVNEAYPAAGSAAAALGTISGAVTVGSGPVPYALVTIIDPTLDITIGGLANADGTYSVQVPPGSYLVYAEPFGVIQPGNLYFTVLQAAVLAGVNFQSTFAGGNTSPTTAKVVANGTATANIAVTNGAGTLSPPQYFTVVPTGASVGRVDGFSGGPVQIASGQTVDLALVGPGYDATLTTSNLHVYGAGVTVTKVAVDTNAGTFGGFALLRVTLNIAARQNGSVATIFIYKGNGSLSLSGLLAITPPTPVFIPASLVSAASYLGSAPGKGAVSPGGYYSLYAPTGSPQYLGPTPYVVNSGYDAYGFLSSRLAGVSVTFDGVAAPLFLVSGGQINLQAPFELAGKTSTTVEVNFFGSTSIVPGVPVLTEQPAFFTITAEGTDSLVYNADGSVNSQSQPAPRATYVTAYGTGVGNVAGLVTGMGAAFENTLTPNYACTIGTTTFPPAFVGWTPTAVALAQFTFQIPTAIPANSKQILKCTNTLTGASTPTGAIFVGN